MIKHRTKRASLHRLAVNFTREASALMPQMFPDQVTPLDELAIHRKCERAFKVCGFHEMPPNPYAVGDLRRAVWVERCHIILRRECRRLEAGGGHRELTANDDWLLGMMSTEWPLPHFDLRELPMAPVFSITSKMESAK